MGAAGLSSPGPAFILASMFFHIDCELTCLMPTCVARSRLALDCGLPHTRGTGTRGWWCGHPTGRHPPPTHRPPVEG